MGWQGTRKWIRQWTGRSAGQRWLGKRFGWCGRLRDLGARRLAGVDQHGGAVHLAGQQMGQGLEGAVNALFNRNAVVR
jgi:hypothetical protein